MYRRECPSCLKTGFIRAERVFTGGKATTEFTCEACGYTFHEADAPSAPPAAAAAAALRPDPADHS